MSQEAGRRGLQDGVARACLFLSLLFLATVLLSVLFLVIEQFLRAESAPEWAQALGGILAVCAAAAIAIAESRRSRHQVAVQIQLQNDTLLHNAKVLEEARVRNREAALSSLKAVYMLLSMAVGALDKGGQIRPTYPNVWQSNYDAARVRLSSIDPRDLGSPSEVQILAFVQIDLEDMWGLTSRAAESELVDFRLFCSGMIRGKLKRMHDFIRSLDPSWVGGRAEAFELSQMELAAMGDDQASDGTEGSSSPP